MSNNNFFTKQSCNLKKFFTCLFLFACAYHSRAQNFNTPFIRNIKTGYLLHTNFSALSPYCNVNELKLSGWETDFAGGKMEVSPKNEMSLNWFKLIDSSSEAGVSIKHSIARQNSGWITFEVRFKLSKLMDDVFWRLIGLDKAGIVIKTNKSNLCFENSNNEPEVIQTYEPGM